MSRYLVSFQKAKTFFCIAQFNSKNNDPVFFLRLYLAIYPAGLTIKALL